MAGGPGQRAFQRDAFLDALVFLLRLGAGQANHRLHGVDALHAIGRTIEPGDQVMIEVIGVFAHALDAGMHGEDRLGMLGREVTAAVGGAGLPE